MKKYFAYYNQYKEGIDIAFADNPLMYATLALYNFSVTNFY